MRRLAYLVVVAALVALAQSVAGYVNHDLIISLQGTDPDNDALVYRIASTPVPGTLYQFTGGGRGGVIAASNTVVSDALGRIVLAPGTSVRSRSALAFAFSGCGEASIVWM